jgi:hypothetical protein
MTTKILKARIAKVDSDMGIVFGYAIVCKEGGEDYFDNDSSGYSEHIPEQTMLSAAKDFAKTARTAKEMHTGDSIGCNLFLFPLTTDIAKALGLTAEKTGLLVGMSPDDPGVLAKFADGTYTGFSIGGERIEVEDSE